MKQFPTLYKRTKTGKIQQWYITAADPVRLTSDLDYALIITSQGQLGGKIQTYQETITEGKQKRTPFEQAVAEAQSSWKKKKDEGYKSLEDLSIQTGASLNINFLIETLNRVLPQSNTDASGNKKPMLSTSEIWEPEDRRITFPCFIQPKLNGGRSLCFLNEENKITFLSREGKIYTTLSHLEEELRPVFDIYPTLILDGEIYKHNTPLNRLMSWLKDFQIETQSLEYHIYDIAMDDMIQSERLEFIITLFSKFPSHLKQVVQVSTNIVNDDIQIALHHKINKTFKYEGSMLRVPKALYQSGSRSKFLVKIKDHIEGEFTIVGAKQGKRGARDMVFILKTEDNKTFESTPKGTIAEKETYWENLSKIKGKKGTIKFYEWTEYGIPFHSTFLVVRDYE